MKLIELQLYQAELETQNQELRNSRQLLEETLDLYSHLYDFAAVACATFSSKGCVEEMNLTGARLLKEERDRLIGLPFARWVHPDSIHTFFSHLRKCRMGFPKVVSSLNLKLRDKTLIPVLLISMQSPQYYVNFRIPTSTAQEKNFYLSFQSALVDLRELQNQNNGELDKVITPNKKFENSLNEEEES